MIFQGVHFYLWFSPVQAQAQTLLESNQGGPGFVDQYADAIVSYENTDTPDAAIGPPDQLTAVVYSEGSIILDMGEGLDGISDKEGPDIVVFERIPGPGRKTHEAAYQVSVSGGAMGPNGFHLKGGLQ